MDFNLFCAMLVATKVLLDISTACVFILGNLFLQSVSSNKIAGEGP